MPARNLGPPPNVVPQYDMVASVAHPEGQEPISELGEPLAENSPAGASELTTYEATVARTALSQLSKGGEALRLRRDVTLRTTESDGGRQERLYYPSDVKPVQALVPCVGGLQLTTSVANDGLSVVNK